MKYVNMNKNNANHICDTTSPEFQITLSTLHAYYKRNKKYAIFFLIDFLYLLWIFFILSLQILLLHTQKVMTFTLHLFNIQFLREMQSWRGNIDECSILRGQERPLGKFQIILSKVISIWFKKIICDDCISQRPIWVTSLSSL